MIRSFLVLVIAAGLAADPLTAQSPFEHRARGDSLYDALMATEAIEEYRAAYQIDPTSYEVMWKLARAHIDVAKQLTDAHTERRDSLYGVARLYADAAVQADEAGAEGHFQLSVALGRLSRTKGGKERVRYAREIYNEAARALELDATHDGAHHVLGAWHAEVQRLSGITKFFAKTFLGAGFMGRASWDSAIIHLERAVELRSDYVYHRLELAEVYVDRQRFVEARHQLERIAELPPTSDVMDPRYQEDAARLLARLREREPGAR